ncbi:EF hand [Cohaesibacter sp. ES.047]|uniref:EF-hand domain-containing protein n=1 Tax=Cohaesibacter sp. ES.047 TaxID=1798205 RepID=UPI000BB88A2E|nr:hypothetical protein [Cohaesibacter sp. ES.047]SNY92707.1 EF hand [Cohaesibacter sp. ES.047]
MFRNTTKCLIALALLAGTTAIAFDVQSASAAGWGRGYGYNCQNIKQGWRGPRYGNRGAFAGQRYRNRPANMGPRYGRMGRGVGYVSMVQKYDADNNGALLKTELSRSVTSYFKERDKNGDQAITLDEFQPRWRTMSEPMRVQTFKQRDANGDGKITLSEMTAPGSAMFSRRDVNNDGRIDSADCPQCRWR